jgi:hypothetical protein
MRFSFKRAATTALACVNLNALPPPLRPALLSTGVGAFAPECFRLLESPRHARLHVMALFSDLTKDPGALNQLAELLERELEALAFMQIQSGHFRHPPISARTLSEKKERDR